MSQTAFDPQVHGFAFANSFPFDEKERAYLRRIFARYFLWGGVLGAVLGGLLGALLFPLGFLGPVVLGLAGVLLILIVVWVVRNQLERHLAPHYGLCGGMCFAALGFYPAGIPIPRGQATGDPPAPGTRLHRYLWKRQMQSIVSDGARFMAWLIWLNYAPPAWPFRGGTAWLLARSKREWQKLEAALDDGEPVPIGLVRAAKNIYDNHQVLAIGYDVLDQTHVTLHLYDPNCPNIKSTIHIQFGERALEGRESCGETAPLRGFFCERTTPANPGAALEPSNG